MGIDLGDNGVTRNDADDTDAGPNNLLNYPIVTAIDRSSQAVEGLLIGVPNETFRIEIFASAEADASNFGEGQRNLGEVRDVVTDATGNATFEWNGAGKIPADWLLTAVAIDHEGNTSEFSAFAPLVVNLTGDQADPFPDDGLCDVAPNQPGSQCTLRAAIQTANSLPGPTSIDFEIPPGGVVPVISIGTPLPVLKERLLLDGLTQGTGGVVLDGRSA